MAIMPFGNDSGSTAMDSRSGCRIGRGSFLAPTCCLIYRLTSYDPLNSPSGEPGAQGAGRPGQATEDGRDKVQCDLVCVPTTQPAASPNSCPGAGNRSTLPAPPPKPPAHRTAYAYPTIASGPDMRGLRWRCFATGRAG